MRKIIVFPVHNRFKILKQAIESVAYLKDYDLVVWDNKSDRQDCVNFLKDLESSGIRVIWTGQDWFFDESMFQIHKRFFGEENYDYIVELNDTAIMLAGSLEEMERAIYSREDFGCVGPVFSHGYHLHEGQPKILGVFDRWYQMNDSRDQIQEFTDACKRGDGIEAAKHFVCREPLVWETVPELDGTAWAVKRECWLAAGSHDPAFKYGWSAHAEYGWRCRDKGFNMICARRAYQWHWDHDYWEGYPLEEHLAYANRDSWVGHVYNELIRRYGSVDAAYRVFNSNFRYEYSV